MPFIFQILRNHVMVRVGGGWDTLQHYLDKHDPCRCNAGKQNPIFQISAKRHLTVIFAHYNFSGHKAASHAQIKLKNGRNGPMAVGVCYDRSEQQPKQALKVPKKSLTSKK